MRKIIDLTGQEFGKLKVIKQVEKNKHGHICWLCECNCEKRTKKICTTNDLRMGKVKSCGCGKSEATIKFNKETKKKYNTYNLTGEYGIGYVSNTNEPFYFDLEDYNKIKDYYWRKSHKGYICTSGKENQFISLHKLILGFTESEDVDHLNRKKEDNRKQNLIPKSHQENMINQNIRSNNSSGVTGVTWDKKKEKWHSYIGYKNKLIHLGFFANIKDAIYVRLKAEKSYGFLGANKKLWGEYGILEEEII